jgi:hypothetical protein
MRPCFQVPLVTASLPLIRVVNLSTVTTITRLNRTGRIHHVTFQFQRVQSIDNWHEFPYISAE